MTSGQETEQVYSYNPEACTVHVDCDCVSETVSACTIAVC